MDLCDGVQHYGSHDKCLPLAKVQIAEDKSSDVITLTVSVCLAYDDQYNEQLLEYEDNLPQWKPDTWHQSPNSQSSIIREYIKNQQKMKQNRIQPQIVTKPDQEISFEELITNAEFDSHLPYGIQNVRDVSSRSANLMAAPRKLKTTFQSLCPSKRAHVYLNIDSDYEYRPDHYEEVECLHAYTSVMDYNSVNNKICGQGGFTCIQLNRTIFLTRKGQGSDCWETEARLVAAGCECMWPQHKFGDIAAHH